MGIIATVRSAELGLCPVALAYGEVHSPYASSDQGEYRSLNTLHMYAHLSRDNPAFLTQVPS